MALERQLKETRLRLVFCMTLDSLLKGRDESVAINKILNMTLAQMS